jgi:hypothetical protein
MSVEHRFPGFPQHSGEKRIVSAHPGYLIQQHNRPLRVVNLLIQGCEGL